MSVPPTLLRSCAAVLLLATGLGAQPATMPLFWPDRTGPTNDGIVPAAEEKCEEAEFIMLKEGRIHFEGHAGELRASQDSYIRSFLS